MKPPSPWIPLLEKAAQDELVVDKLMTFADSPPEIIGFHLLESAGHRIPESLGRLRDLTPYAAELRYDFVPAEEEEILDPSPYREMVRQLRAWVEELVGERSEEAGR